MARYPLNVADRDRFARLVDAGLMPVALLLPRMSSRERVSFVCRTAARGLLPELTQIATESASVDARAAVALAEEDPAAALTFRDEASFWSEFGARHPSPRGRWRGGDQGLALRHPGSGRRAAKAPVISPPEAGTSPPEAREISTTVPPADARPGNGAPIPERTGRARRHRRVSSVSAELAVRDLPEWALDILETLPPLVTRAAAAKALVVSVKTLDRRIEEHVLTAVHVGSRVLVPRLALVGYLVTQSH